MGHYKIRHFLILCVLGGTAAATCGVSPAVEELRERVAALEVESDGEFVVVDSAGTLVGPMIGQPGTLALQALVNLEGLPLFTVEVQRDRLRSSSNSVSFISSDCTGPAYFETSTRLIMPKVLINPTPGESSYISDTSVEPQVIVFQSRILGETDCVVVEHPTPAVPAIPVFIHDEEFAPPFEVVTVGELGWAGGD